MLGREDVSEFLAFWSVSHDRSCLCSGMFAGKSVPSSLRGFHRGFRSMDLVGHLYKHSIAVRYRNSSAANASCTTPFATHLKSALRMPSGKMWQSAQKAWGTLASEAQNDGKGCRTRPGALSAGHAAHSPFVPRVLRNTAQPQEQAGVKLILTCQRGMRDARA